MTVLNQTLRIVAIPTIIADFQISTNLAQWVTTVSLLITICNGNRQFRNPRKKGSVTMQGQTSIGGTDPLFISDAKYQRDLLSHRMAEKVIEKLQI